MKKTMCYLHCTVYQYNKNYIVLFNSTFDGSFMTLDRFRYFLAAAKFQNITMAGKASHISPSAISSAVAQLEKEFHCQLFRREGKYVFLTDKGYHLKEKLEALFDQITMIQKTIGGPEIEIRGNFRIGGSHFLSNRYLSSAWCEMFKEFPLLQGELIAMHTANILIEMLQGKIDFALCFSPTVHPELNMDVLYAGQLRIAVNTKHPIFKLPEKELYKKISNYPAIIHKSSPGIEPCDNHPIFSKFHITANVQVFFDSDDQAIECLRNSDAWTMIPDIVGFAYKKYIRMLPKLNEWHAPYTIASVTPIHRKQNTTLDYLKNKVAIRLKETLKLNKK